MSNPLWHNFHALGQFFILINGQSLKNNPAIWSHWLFRTLLWWGKNSSGVIGWSSSYSIRALLIFFSAYHISFVVFNHFQCFKQCDQIATPFVQCVAIFNNENLTNCIIIRHRRFKILANTKLTLNENCKISQSGHTDCFCPVRWHSTAYGRTHHNAIQNIASKTLKFYLKYIINGR